MLIQSIHRASALALFVALAAAPARPDGALGAQTPVVQPGNVRASGNAEVTVEPDLAVVTIQYSAAGKTPAIAGRTAARHANAIRAAIIALGIPADSIPTSSMGGYWGSWGNRSSIQVRNDMRDTSYVTNDAFTVRVRDLKLVGRVIDTAMAEGAQTVSNVEFQATNTEPAQLEAIKRATQQARARAAAMSAAAGLTLGRVVTFSIDAQPGVLSMAKTMNEGMAFARTAAPSTTVVAPELKVSVSVSGVWELVQPGR